MTSLLITLVSEQTIPNILCVEYFKPDAILFITTEKMENKIEPTMESIKYVFNENKYIQNKNVYTLKTREDSVVSVVRSLEKWIKDNESKYDKFIVNITLGTKFMSIGILEALRYNEKTDKIVYLPLNENLIKLIPEWILKRSGENTQLNNEGKSLEFSELTEEKEIEISIARRLMILEYCKAYNVDISNFKYLEIYKKHAVEDEIFVKWIIDGYFDEESYGNTIMKSILSEFFIKLQFYRNDKKNKNILAKGDRIPISKNLENLEFKYPSNDKLNLEVNTEKYIQIIKQFFDFDKIKKYIAITEITPGNNENKNIKIKITGNIDKAIIDLLTGGWLEEFCFNEVNTLKELGIVDDVALNPVITKKDGTENEIDVMFTSSNKIYMIECKSLQQEYDKNSEIFYKIHSIQNKVGRLATKSFLVSTATDNLLAKDKDIKKLKEMSFKDSVLKRAKELNTTTIHPALIKNLKDELKNILKKELS